MVSMPRSLIASGPREALLASFLALLIVTAFGLALAWWSAGRLIVKPAKAILRGAEEITQGNLTARVKLESAYQGELGSIGRAFNRMADSLQTRVRDVDDAVARLVHERAIRDLILDSMSEGVLAVDTQGQILLFNKAVGELFPLPGQGVALDDWRAGHEFLDLDGTRVYPLAERPLTLAMRGASIDRWDVLLRNPGKDDKVLRVSARPIRDGAGQLLGAVAVFSDITGLRAAEKFEQGQQEVLTLIARGAPLRESCEAIVRLVGGTSPDGMCSISLVQGQRLHAAAVIGLPQPVLDIIDSVPIANDAGACGRSAFLKQLVVVENTATDPLMADFRGVLLAHDLQACWSTPVLSAAGKVLATFAIYHHRVRRPQAKDLELLDTSTGTCAWACPRAWANACACRARAARCTCAPANRSSPRGCNCRTPTRAR